MARLRLLLLLTCITLLLSLFSATLVSCHPSIVESCSHESVQVQAQSENTAPLHTTNHVKRYGSGAPYWFSEITRQGKVAYGTNSSYIVWRNVMDYGAKGRFDMSIAITIDLTYCR